MTKTAMIFADVETTGATPTAFDKNNNMCVMTEFGLVDYMTGKTFHGVLWTGVDPEPENPALPVMTDESVCHDHNDVAADMMNWLKGLGADRFVLVSDNPGFDAMWMNCYCWDFLGESPFGYSSRRIGDFFAGFTGDWKSTSKWKSLRSTTHTHNPVEDALGNAEAVAKIAPYVKGLDMPGWAPTATEADARVIRKILGD